MKNTVSALGSLKAQLKVNTLFTIMALSCVLVMVSGCATQDKVAEPEEVQAKQQLVWPGPPEQPRIRYVRSLKSFEDVTGKWFAFAAFLPDQNLPPFRQVDRAVIPGAVFDNGIVVFAVVFNYQ